MSDDRWSSGPDEERWADRPRRDLWGQPDATQDLGAAGLDRDDPEPRPWGAEARQPVWDTGLDDPSADGWGPELTGDLGARGSGDEVWGGPAWEEGGARWSSGAGAGWEQQQPWEAGDQQKWSAAGQPPGPDREPGGPEPWGPELTGELGAQGSGDEVWGGPAWEEGGARWSSGAGWEQQPRDAGYGRQWSFDSDVERWDAGYGQQWSPDAQADPPDASPGEQQPWNPDATAAFGAQGSVNDAWRAPAPDATPQPPQSWEGDDGAAWSPDEGDVLPWEPQAPEPGRWATDPGLADLTAPGSGEHRDWPAWDQPAAAGGDPSLPTQASWQAAAMPGDALTEPEERDNTETDLWDDDATLPPTPLEEFAPRIKGKGTKGARKAPSARVLVPMVATVLLVGLAAAEAILLPPTEQTAAPVPQEAASAGLWYCPVVVGDGEEASLAIAAASDQPSEVTVVRHTLEGPVSGSPETVTPDAQLQVPLEHAEPVSVRWSGGPSVVTWSVSGEQAIAAPCEAGPSPVWYLAGLNTAAGSESILHLFNPFPADAVARVVFATPEGPVTLVTTDNVLVRGGEGVRLNLGDVQPEIADFGLIVEVQAGRLVAQGEVTFDPIEGETGPSGRTLVPAAPAPADFWAFGFARADETSFSWLDIQNPGEREAAVEVRVSSPAAAGSLLGEVDVPAGGSARIDLADVSEDAEFGVAVEVVNDVPVVVTRTAALRTEDDREGVAASLGAAPATRWALAGAGTAGRGARLGLYNPGTETATVEVDAGPGTPEEWGTIEVQANARVQLELADVDPDRAGFPVRVQADRPVVPELRSLSNDGPLGSWTAPAAPAITWAGPETRPAVRRNNALPSVPLVSVERQTEPAPDADE